MPSLWLAAVLWAQTAGGPPADAGRRAGPAIVRGAIVDARTNEPIADARVTLTPVQPIGGSSAMRPSASDRPRWLNTGADGRFEFRDVPAGAYTLTVSTIGYIFVRRTIDAAIERAVDLVVPLAEGTGTYQETVHVSGAAAPVPKLGIASQLELGSAGLQELRGVAADDPMRAMQALPGVATGDDFQAEFSVRGSAFRHVGVVIDGTPTPVLVHTVRGAEDTGSIAMINTDVLSGASLVAGPHPRRHGHWLGATLEFDVREGSRDRYGARGAVSGTSASAVFEGPFGPSRRGSWLVSLRKSYLDWLIRKVEPDVDSTIGFVDGIAKAAYDLTSRQQAQFLILGGRSTYREQQASPANGLLRATASSGLLSASWRYAREQWVLTTRSSFVGSDFRNFGVVSQELARGYTHSVTVRADFSTALGRGWTLDAGARRERSRLNHVLREFVAAGPNRVRIAEARDVVARTTLLSGWAQVSHRTGSGGIVIGVSGVSRTLADREPVLPWILAERIAGRLTFRGSVGRSAQFPDPIFVSLDAGPIRPERAWSVDAGLDYRVSERTQGHVTAFHRTESDLLHDAGEARVANEGQTRIRATTFPVFRQSLHGTTHGVDVVLRHRSASGVLGWIGYTWAHTRHRDTATGERFDGDFDQRHTLNAFAQLRLSYRMLVGAKLRVGSNFPVVGYFTANGEALRLSMLRNQVRLPTYARLDLRGSRTFTTGRGRLTLFVELMNALGRRNIGPAEGFVRPNLDAVGFLERLIPFVPSAGMLIEF